MVYFDNSSTTYVYPEVIETITDILKNHFGNPSNLYTFGLESKMLIEDARSRIAKCLKVEPEELIFTSCASESNATAINQCEKCLCSPYDHHDIKDNKKSIIIDEDYLIRCEQMDYATQLYYKQLYKNYLWSHTLVSSETGEIFDVEAMAQPAKRLGMKVLVDATQALGNIPVYPHDYPSVDFMSFSLHKCHAPKGIGLLYIKKDLLKDITPLIYGTQESNIRGGTSNVPYIVGGALAVEKSIQEILQKQIHCKDIKDYILNRLNDYGVDYIENRGTNNLNSVLNIAFKNITGESIMLMLDAEGICVSTGTACTSGDLKPSDALMDMEVPPEYIQGAIRISIGLQNTLEDAEKLVQNLKKITKTS